MALMRFTVLGCGSSPGVPRISGDWGDCDPNEPRNRRTRAALLVERIAEDGGKTVVVIDTGPDFRAQMLAAKVTHLDGVVYTHAHADHIHGIDDLRGYWISQRELIQTYSDDATYARLMEGFGYCFQKPEGSSYPPIVARSRIEHYQRFSVMGAGGEIVFEPLKQVHGSAHSLGFRIGGLAYCTDVSDFPERNIAALQGLDVLIIDALQYQPHPSHLSLSETLHWIDVLKPKRAYLTHMHTPLDYMSISRETPDHVLPSYDGMTIELEVD
ncbi:MAG: MBL fold metallo-hydrolase [Rhizobiaceae bacterium]